MPPLTGHKAVSLLQLTAAPARTLGAPRSRAAPHNWRARGRRHESSGTPAGAAPTAPRFLSWRAQSTVSSSRVLLLGPLFLHALHARHDFGQPLVEAKAWGVERWHPIIGERTPHRNRIAAHQCGCGILPIFDRSFDRPNTAHALLQLLLGVAVGRKHGRRGFA